MADQPTDHGDATPDLPEASRPGSHRAPTPESWWPEEEPGHEPVPAGDDLWPSSSSWDLPPIDDDFPIDPEAMDSLEEDLPEADFLPEDTPAEPAEADGGWWDRPAASSPVDLLFGDLPEAAQPAPEEPPAEPDPEQFALFGESAPAYDVSDPIGEHATPQIPEPHGSAATPEDPDATAAYDWRIEDDWELPSTAAAPVTELPSPDLAGAEAPTPAEETSTGGQVIVGAFPAWGQAEAPEVPAAPAGLSAVPIVEAEPVEDLEEPSSAEPADVDAAVAVDETPFEAEGASLMEARAEPVADEPEVLHEVAIEPAGAEPSGMDSFDLREDSPFADVRLDPAAPVAAAATGTFDFDLQPSLASEPAPLSTPVAATPFDLLDDARPVMGPDVDQLAIEPESTPDTSSTDLDAPAEAAAQDTEVGATSWWADESRTADESLIDSPDLSDEAPTEAIDLSAAGLGLGAAAAGGLGAAALARGSADDAVELIDQPTEETVEVPSSAATADLGDVPETPQPVPGIEPQEWHDDVGLRWQSFDGGYIWYADDGQIWNAETGEVLREATVGSASSAGETEAAPAQTQVMAATAVDAPAVSAPDPTLAAHESPPAAKSTPAADLPDYVKYSTRSRGRTLLTIVSSPLLPQPWRPLCGQSPRVVRPGLASPRAPAPWRWLPGLRCSTGYRRWSRSTRTISQCRRARRPSVST